MRSAKNLSGGNSRSTAIPIGDSDVPSSIHVDEPLTMEAAIAMINSWGILISRRVSMRTVRPLNIFLGISGPSAFCFSPTAFAPPTRHLDKTAPEKISSRLFLNLKYFLSNYALVAAGVALVVALSHPVMLLNLLFLWCLWFFHHKSIALGGDIPKLMGRDLNEIAPPQIRATVLKILTILIIVMQCLGPFLSVLLLSSFLILTHAILRDPKDVMAARNNPSQRHTRGSDDSDEEDDSEYGGSDSNSMDDSSHVLVDRNDAVIG